MFGKVGAKRIGCGRLQTAAKSPCRSHVLHVVVPIHMYLLKHYCDVVQQRLGDLGRAPFNKGKTFFNIEG